MMRLPFFTHRFMLQGLNLERFLNLMQHADIPLKSVRRKDARTLECECCSADLAAVSALAAEKGWTMQVLEPHGLAAVCARIRSRPGIIVGLTAALLCLMILSQFVWQIDVRNAGAHRADITAYLEESGVRRGMLRHKVDAQMLENALTYRYPDLAWFQVYVRSATLVVDVAPGVPVPKLPGKEAADIVARQDGIIQNLFVYAGTPLVKNGDAVRKGQLLIRGEERSADGQMVPVRAKGEIHARCWESFTVKMPFQDISSSETGREIAAVRIHTPWFDWPAQLPQPDYLAWNTYMTQTPVGGVFLPVFFQRFSFRETALEYTQRPLEDVRAEAAEAALQQLQTALFPNEIIDKWVDYCMIEDDTLAATVTAELLVDIGEYASP